MSKDSLTMIITTSPTPSCPSTELLTSVLDSIRRHCPCLLLCHVIVVMDGYHSVTEQSRLKKGRIEAEQAAAYAPYKEKVKSLILAEFSCLPAEPESQMGRVFYNQADFGEGRSQSSISCKITQFDEGKISFIEPERCLGFGLAVRSALRITTTPYVWVHQHDWALLADLPISTMVQIMRESEHNHDTPIKYICLPAVRMLSYATSNHVMRYPALRGLTNALGGEYCIQDDTNARIPLTPLFFWHDKPHISSTDHYLQCAFPFRSSIRRGEFIEDKIGQKSREDMKQGRWHKWATWFYYPENGHKLCVKHLQGRTRERINSERKGSVKSSTSG